MAVSSSIIVARRRRRSTYRRPRLVPAPARPAAHRARYTARQVAAIRRRRAFVRKATPTVMAAVYWTAHTVAAILGFAAITCWMFLLVAAPAAAAWGLSLTVCMWGLYRVRTAATR